MKLLEFTRKNLGFIWVYGDYKYRWVMNQLKTGGHHLAGSGSTAPPMMGNVAIVAGAIFQHDIHGTHRFSMILPINCS